MNLVYLLAGLQSDPTLCNLSLEWSDAADLVHSDVSPAGPLSQSASSLDTVD